MIKPAIGMPVIFHPYPSADNPLGLEQFGFIARVWGDTCVDIAIAAAGAFGASRFSSVLLHQGSDGQPDPGGVYWCQFPDWFVRLMTPRFLFDADAIPADIDPELLHRHAILVVAPNVPGFIAPDGTPDPVRCENARTECVNTPTWAETSQTRA